MSKILPARKSGKGTRLHKDLGLCYKKIARIRVQPSKVKCTLFQLGTFEMFRDDYSN